jgi:serine kinase of HPr protein (carbohydrate metabolism regulator)
MVKIPNKKKVPGTSVEVEGLGVLLRGPSGSGKSDLALRLIDSGARLIADDYTELSLRNSTLIANAPETIRNLLEVRGIGILKISGVLQAKLGVIIDLVTIEKVERRPKGQSEELLGIKVPLFRLVPLEASGPAKVRLIVRQIKGSISSIS